MPFLFSLVLLKILTWSRSIVERQNQCLPLVFECFSFSSAEHFLFTRDFHFSFSVRRVSEQRRQNDAVQRRRIDYFRGNSLFFIVRQQNFELSTVLLFVDFSLFHFLFSWISVQYVNTFHVRLFLDESRKRFSDFAELLHLFQRSFNLFDFVDLFSARKRFFLRPERISHSIRLCLFVFVVDRRIFRYSFEQTHRSQTNSAMSNDFIFRFTHLDSNSDRNSMVEFHSSTNLSRTIYKFKFDRFCLFLSMFDKRSILCDFNLHYHRIDRLYDICVNFVSIDKQISNDRSNVLHNFHRKISTTQKHAPIFNFVLSRFRLDVLVDFLPFNWSIFSLSHFDFRIVYNRNFMFHVDCHSSSLLLLQNLLVSTASREINFIQKPIRRRRSMEILHKKNKSKINSCFFSSSDRRQSKWNIFTDNSNTASLFQKHIKNQSNEYVRQIKSINLWSNNDCHAAQCLWKSSQSITRNVR